MPPERGGAWPPKAGGSEPQHGSPAPGFCGSQPETADWYTNNGSLYMTSLAFMPLGLPANHLFWTDEAQPWTQVKAWGGQPFPKDHRWGDDIQTRDKW